MFIYIKASALFILIVAKFVFAQVEQQVSMGLSMSFNIPYVGPINKLDTFVFGPNVWHHTETTKAKRFYAKMLVNDSKGKIIDTKNELFFKYNIEDKEYQQMPFEKALYKKDSVKTKNSSSKKKRSSWSVGFGGGESSIDSVYRTKQHGGTVLGVESIKWTTTIIDSSGGILIIQEWETPQLPALRLADSLNKSLQLSLGRPDTSIAEFGAGFSNMILKSTNVNHQLPQINGEIIKAVIQSFEENESDPTFTMELEITNLLIEPLNREDFIVPQQYTITNK
ncbi:uncharacterized protein METZ01_LOCUS2566 [marine metagenome]|uniref:DUF4412 domain-containing protein n=1 Tax=marine metagenome TaxID=408172 RepID=A0A381N534_9ZZZZ